MSLKERTHTRRACEEVGCVPSARGASRLARRLRADRERDPAVVARADARACLFSRAELRSIVRESAALDDAAPCASASLDDPARSAGAAGFLSTTFASVRSHADVRSLVRSIRTSTAAAAATRSSSSRSASSASSSSSLRVSADHIAGLGDLARSRRIRSCVVVRRARQRDNRTPHT